MRKTRRMSWQKLSKHTGINIAVLKAVDLTKKVEKVRGIQI